MTAPAQTPARAEPLWFGPGDRPLLGFFHAAAPALQRRCAVVLCYPFGHEYTAVYQAYRRLAEELACAGFPVLRFDYDGTGDSAGEDADPGRLHAWLASARSAIDKVLELSGASEVCLFGLRLGAMLAYLAAEHRSVRSLVLWAPSLTGKSYLREFRALRQLKGDGPDLRSTLSAGDEEAGGFLMTRETLSDLSKVDLVAAPPPSACRVLLLARDALCAEERLAKHLKARGVEVDCRHIPGYSTLVVEPYNVVIPSAVFAETLAWLTVIYPEPAEPRPARPPDQERATTARIPYGQAMVRESVLRFGANDALLGVLAEPSQVDPDRPVLLLLNTSVIHRVGPNRMYVPMSRSWAAAGFAVFRMDLSGLGDSPLPGWQARQRMYSKDGVKDARAAMDFLSTRLGARRFVLIGLCSGAYMAFHTGLEEQRVMAQVLINAQTFDWKEGDSVDVGRKLEYKSFRFYARAAFKRKTWERLLQGEVRWKGILEALSIRALRYARTSLAHRVARFRSQHGLAGTTISRFKKLLGRGVRVFLIYSQEDPGLDELALQVGRNASRLRAHRAFRIELIEGPDHTFTPIWSQKRVEQLITDAVKEWSARP